MNVIANTHVIEPNSHTAALLDRLGQSPEGCDPDFDNGLEEVESEFAAPRLQLAGE